MHSKIQLESILGELHTLGQSCMLQFLKWIDTQYVLSSTVAPAMPLTALSAS